MTINKFMQLLNDVNAIRVTDALFLFNDLELYDATTDLSEKYDSIDELLKRNKNIKDIINNVDDFYFTFDGGRGSISGTKKAFGHADLRGSKNDRELLLNAELNIGTAQGNSIDKVLKRFQDKYGKADREYAIVVEENGYVKEHVKGAKHSVSAIADLGSTVIHNHPSGSHFSDMDLLNIASSGGKTIIATSSNSKIKGTYTFTKTNHFDAKGFIKGINNAKVSSRLTYNQGVDKWLKDNAKKYGYKYTKSNNANLKGM